MALIVALYSWSLVSSSSPGSKLSERRTVLTPVVALGTKASPSGSAWRNASDVAACGVHEPPQIAAQEAHGLALHPRPKPLLQVEHRRGTRRRTSRGSGR
jgi:hypothetical protein